MMRPSPDVYEETPETENVLERLREIADRELSIEDDFSAVEEGLRSNVTPEQLATNQEALQVLRDIGNNPLVQELLFNQQTLRVNHEPEHHHRVIELTTLRIRYFKLREVRANDKKDRVTHRFFVGEVDGVKGVHLKRIPELASISDMRRSRLPTETDIGYDAEYLAAGAEKSAQWQRDPSNIFVPKHSTVEILRQLEHRRGLLRRAGEWVSQIVVGYR